jgi:urease accessory protein
MPHVANPLTYAIGFVLATGLLHLSGIAVGLLTRWNTGRIAVRLSGGVIGVIGLGFLLHLI